MDNHNAGNGHASLTISAILGIFSLISYDGIGEVLKTIAACTSIVAGVMAIRYYVFAIKEKKKNLKT